VAQVSGDPPKKFLARQWQSGQTPDSISSRSNRPDRFGLKKKRGDALGAPPHKVLPEPFGSDRLHHAVNRLVSTSVCSVDLCHELRAPLALLVVDG